MSFHQDFSNRSILTSSPTKPKVLVKTVFRNPLTTRTNKTKTIAPPVFYRPETSVKVSTFSNQESRGPFPSTDGWTVLTQAPGSRTIYVSSSSGNDSTGDGSIGNPYATLAKGVSFLRDGNSDWLLLKKGDTWNEVFGRFQISGKSILQPLLISSYGVGARPIIKATALNQDCISFFATARNYWAFIGLDFYCSVRDPGSPDFLGVGTANCVAINNTAASGVGFIIEDCKIHFWTTAIVMSFGTIPGSNLKIRRNIIFNQYPINSISHSQGVFAAGVQNTFLIEENVIDSNGWRTARDAGSVFNHNIYIDHETSGNYPGGPGGDGSPVTGPVTLIGNILSRDSEGLQLRSGGTVSNNLWLQSPLNSNIGGAAGDTKFINNVCLESIFDAVNSQGPGVGPNFAGFDSTPNTSIVTGNIFAHPTNTGSVGVSLQSAFNGITTNGLSVINNIFFGVTTPISDNSSGTNILTPNSIDQGGYPDSSRTIGGYAGTLGLTASTLAFLTAALNLSKDNWNPLYTANGANNYIKAGFGL